MQSLSHVQLFATHGLQHTRIPCPSPTPGAYSNSCPSSRWCRPTISSSVRIGKNLHTVYICFVHGYGKVNINALRKPKAELSRPFSAGQSVRERSCCCWRKRNTGMFQWKRSHYMCHLETVSLSRVGLFVTSWTAARQAPLSMGFSRQECWIEFPPPRNLPDPGTEPTSPALASGFFTTEPPDVT